MIKEAHVAIMGPQDLVLTENFVGKVNLTLNPNNASTHFNELPMIDKLATSPLELNLNLSLGCEIVV